MKLDSDEYAPVKVDDITSFIAQLEGDVIANFMVTKCAIGESNTIKYELYGTDGIIKFNLNNPSILEVCIGDVDKETGSIHTINVPATYSLSEEDCFIRSGMGEKLPHFPDINDRFKAQQVVDAVLKSAQTGKLVEIKYYGRMLAWLRLYTCSCNCFNFRSMRHTCFMDLHRICTKQNIGNPDADLSDNPMDCSSISYNLLHTLKKTYGQKGNDNINYCHFLF